MAATLRRTFRFPGDEDEGQDQDIREELDEQEQDNIIKTLQQKNDKDNRFYHTIFTVVPLVATIAYVPGLLSSSVSTGQRLTYIVCVLSLSATAYVMESVLSSNYSKNKNYQDDIRPLLTALMNDHRWSPRALSETNRKHIEIVNWALCAVMTLGSAFAADSQGGTVSQSTLYLLPGLFLGITSLAGQFITEVDVGELEKLRYEYKGA